MRTINLKTFKLRYVRYLFIYCGIITPLFCMDLKYQAHISKYCPSDCPPTSATEKNIAAFRLVNAPITAKDFKTYVTLGKVPRQTDKIHAKCMACGLSLFSSLEGAEKRIRSYPQRSKLPYTHIAKGDIKPLHGICTDIKYFHFTIHEFERVNLISVFKIVQSISTWKI